MTLRVNSRRILQSSSVWGLGVLAGALALSCSAGAGGGAQSDAPHATGKVAHALTSSVSSVATGKLVLQPGADQSQDALLVSLNPKTNYGTYDRFGAAAWTWNSVAGTQRGLLRFDLSNVPSGAKITKATLSLYGESGAAPRQSSTLSGSNAATLQQVIEPWTASTVTWDTQPKTTTDGQVQLAASSGATQNYTADVTALVQNMQNSGQNYGFMLELAQEQAYRALMFGSSDETNAALRPKLEVEFSQPNARVAAEDVELYFEGPSGLTDEDQTLKACGNVNIGLEAVLPDMEFETPESETDRSSEIRFEVQLGRDGVAIGDPYPAFAGCFPTEEPDPNGDGWLVTGYSCTPAPALLTVMNAQSGHYSAVLTVSGAGISEPPVPSNAIQFTFQSGTLTCPIGTPSGANCFVATAPNNSHPFITNNKFYYTPPPTCPLAGSNYDGANCLVATAPTGTKAFQLNNNLYYTPVPSCPVAGSVFDGAHCYVASAPANTTAFQLNGNLYYTPPPSCPMPGSKYDGANCYVAPTPAGSTPFQYNGNLYYTPQPGHSCPVQGSWYDGANCFVGVPSGASGFSWNNGLYYKPLHGTTCPLAGSWYDGANCFVTKVPAGSSGFAWNNALYYNGLPGTGCPLPGSSYDGANCLVAKAPNGSTAFELNNNLYYTPVPGTTCSLAGSTYDGANCLVASVPPGGHGFVSGNSLYYGKICQ